MPTRPLRYRRGGSPKVSRSSKDVLIGVIFVAGAVGFFVYKNWNTPPLTPIVGRAWVIDGDTINISGTHIRLEGIDAPESDQPCTDAKGTTWACGRTAASELKAHIRGEELTCQPKAFDKYGRVVAVCSLPDGANVNAWMVREGWAVAYGFTNTYGFEEAQARAAHRGIWAGSFVTPSQWRQAGHD